MGSIIHFDPIPLPWQPIQATFPDFDYKKVSKSWNKKGIEHATAGNYYTALQHFR